MLGHSGCVVLSEHRWVSGETDTWRNEVRSGAEQDSNQDCLFDRPGLCHLPGVLSEPLEKESGTQRIKDVHLFILLPPKYFPLLFVSPPGSWGEETSKRM